MTCYFGTKFDATTEYTSTYLRLLDLNVTSRNRLVHSYLV